MKNALVTSIGSVAGDIVIKTLKKLGFYIVGTDIYQKELVVDAFNVNKFYQAPYTSESDKYFDFLKKICVEEKINFILPLTDLDVDFLNARREWFDENNVTLCISPKHSLDIIRNKKKLQDFVKDKCPFTNSIPTVLLKDVKKLEWNFPVVCKPYDGRSSQGLRYIYNEKEWQSFIKENPDDKYIVEPFIEGPIVMVEIVRQTEPRKVVAVTRQEKLSTPHGCATAVYMYQDKELEENSRKLADALDIKGCVNFEYIHGKDGKYYLVECNPRFSAGCEFTCISGYDCVSNHIRVFENKPIDGFEFQHPMYISRKYEEYITKVED